MLSLRDIFDVYSVHATDDGTIEYRIAGRVLVHEGFLIVLSDYRGLLCSLPKGSMSDTARAAWEGLRRNPYFLVVSIDEVSWHPPVFRATQRTAQA